MTAAEENVLRAAVNPWPLYVSTIARDAKRSPATTRRHLRTLKRHGLVKTYSVASHDHKGAWMVTEAGHAAVQNIDAMRTPA